MRRPVFALACILAALSFVPALVAPARAQSSSELAPTWGEQISRSTVELREEEAKLAEAEADLREAEQDGSSYSYIDSRQERVDFYEQSVAVARVRVGAAEKAQAKQQELDRQGEPQGDAHELKEVITYFEAVESGAQAAGDEATADEAKEELDGGVLGAGLRERLKVAEAEQAAAEAARQASEETTAQEPTQIPEDTEATTAPPPAGGQGGDGGGGRPEPAPPPEPAPNPEPSPGIPAPNPLMLVVLALFALGASAYLLPRLPGAVPVVSRLRRALAHGMASHGSRNKAARGTATNPAPAPEPAAQVEATPSRDEGGRAPTPGEAPEASSATQAEHSVASDLDDVFGFDAGAPDDADDPPDAGASEGGEGGR